MDQQIDNFYQRWLGYQIAYNKNPPREQEIQSFSGDLPTK